MRPMAAVPASAAAECSTSYTRVLSAARLRSTGIPGRRTSIAGGHLVAPQRHLAARAAAPVTTSTAVAAAAADPAAAPAAAAAAAPPAAADADAKRALLSAIEYTRRGANTTRVLRGAIEEAQVALEALQASSGLDYALLEGKWRLLYTTAADVVPIVGLDLSAVLPAGLPAPVVVGDVFQRFSSVEEGRVENIIEFGLPPFTPEKNGVTFTVGASYEVRSPRRISLTFLDAQVGQVATSPLVDAVLAPALLPRGWWNQRALLAIKEFSLRFPFRSAQQVAAGRAVGASYLLTYLDENVLIGRAPAPAGTFIFTRA